VIAGPDNAAIELVVEGENGFIAESASAADVAACVLKVRAAGQALRISTAAWFARNAERLSLSHSVEIVRAVYG
jgi:hypothetical protein